MSSLSRYFRSGATMQTGHTDVIHNNTGIVFFTPLFDVYLVKPSVKFRNKMVPLQNFQVFFDQPEPGRG